MSRKLPKKKAKEGTLPAPAIGVVPTLNKLPDFRSYYANNTTFQVTPWDVTLTFGRITDIKDGLLVVDQSAQVSVSLQHAKAIVEVLAKQLQAYEESNGPLAIAPYQVMQTSKS